MVFSCFDEICNNEVFVLELRNFEVYYLGGFVLVCWNLYDFDI